jgi:hypothetical protein
MKQQTNEGHAAEQWLDSQKCQCSKRLKKEKTDTE